MLAPGLPRSIASGGNGRDEGVAAPSYSRPPAAQSGNVLGFRSLAEDLAGIECEKKETIRETVDALRTRKDFLPEVTIPRAIRRMFIERRCGGPEAEDRT